MIRVAARACPVLAMLVGCTGGTESGQPAVTTSAPEASATTESIETVAEITRLLEAAASGDAMERLRAIDELNGVDAVRFAPQLIAALDSGSPYVREIASKKLRDSQSPLAVPKLIRVLQSDDAEAVRRSAAVALGDLHAPEAMEPLLAAARSDSSEDVRRFATIALGELGMNAAVLPLAVALEEPDREPSAQVREAISGTLAKLRDPRAVPTLIAYYESAADPAAITALGEIGDSVAMQFLKATLVQGDARGVAQGIVGHLLRAPDGVHDAFLIEQARSNTDPAARAAIYSAVLDAELAATRRQRFEESARNSSRDDASDDVRRAAGKLVAPPRLPD